MVAGGKSKNRAVSLLERLVSEGHVSDEEAKVVLKQLKTPRKRRGRHNHDFGRGSFKFLVISDTHIGHSMFRHDLLMKAFAVAKREGAEAIYHCGDIIEGMYPSRPGHVYELDAVGGSAQLGLASELLSLAPTKVYGITGNHDDTLRKFSGVVAGAELESRCGNFEFLGHDEADIDFGDGVVLKLFHPNDGSAYATSYKLQKLIESFSGGEKPSIVFEGHYHKSLYLFVRNVHGFEAGSLIGQTRFMRGRKLSNSLGFWVVEASKKKRGRGLAWVRPVFYPEYRE